MKTLTVSLSAAAIAVMLAVFAFVSPSTLAQTGSSRSDAGAPRAEVIAVKFHADWCGYCKAMGPVFEELQAKYDKEPALYITFDQTREFGRTQSAYHARALGLADVWGEYGGKTGFVLLIDAESGRVMERLSHEQGLKQMGAALQEAVRSAS